VACSRVAGKPLTYTSPPDSLALFALNEPKCQIEVWRQNHHHHSLLAGYL
jgi:hypothetical protein